MNPRQFLNRKPRTVATAGFIVLIVLAAVATWIYLDTRCSACAPVGIHDIPPSNFALIRGSVELETRFTEAGFDPAAGHPKAWPRIYVRSLPTDLGAVGDLDRRKQLFTLIVLPQVLRLNEAILADRHRMVSLWKRSDAGEGLTGDDFRWMAATARRYGTPPDDRRSLLRRLDIVPPGLALAQASIESGWGTSRFARGGNAIFGQRTYDPDGYGIRPDDVESPAFKVKAFPSLMRSIWGYMLTLNIHPAYSDFRDARARARRTNDAFDSMALARTLTRYSEKGQTYVNLVREVIAVNDFARLDSAHLTPAPPPR